MSDRSEAVHQSAKPRRVLGEPVYDSGGLKSAAVRGAFVKTLSHSVVAPAQIISGVVLARLLVPDDYGLVAIVTAFTMILSEVGELGLSQAIVQAEKPTHEQVTTLFWINLALSIVMAAAFAAIAPLLAYVYEEPRLMPIAVVLGSGFVLRGLATQHLGLLTRSMRFTAVAGIELTAVTLSITVAIVMALFGWGYWALVARRMVTFLVSAVGAWILSEWRPSLRINTAGVGPLIRYGIHCLGAQMLLSFRQNVDKMLLGWSGGAAPLGLYDRAQQIFVLPFNQVTSPLAGVAVSTLSKLRDDPERYRKYCLEAVSLVAFVGMALTVVMTVAATGIVELLLGPEWSEVGSIVVAFGPALGLLLLSSTLSWIHLSLGRADRSMKWNLLMLTGSVVSVLAGLRYGAIGVAIAYSISLHVLIWPGFAYAGKPIGLSLRSVVAVTWRHFAAAAIATVVCWYGLVAVRPIAEYLTSLHPAAKVAIVTVAAGSMYVFLSVVLHGSDQHIRRHIGLASAVGLRRRKPPIDANAATSQAR